MNISPFALLWRNVLLAALVRLGTTDAIPPRRDGTPARCDGRRRGNVTGVAGGKRDPMPGRLSRKRLEPRP